jgi:hypothetical protein
MNVEVNLPGRWRAALVLLVPALLGFQIALFNIFGPLLMLGAAFAAAVWTGYARRDAVGVAVGCSVLVLIGSTLELAHPASLIIAYALAAAVAIRPPGRLATGVRVAGSSALILLAGHLRTLGEVHAWGRVHGWWVLLVVPLVVACSDVVADAAETSEPDVPSPSQPTAEGGPPARTGLMLVSAAALVVVLLPWILGYGDGYGWLRLGTIGLALAAAAVGAARAAKSVRASPLRSTGTIALSIVPIVILGWILFVVLTAALGNGFQIGN